MEVSVREMADMVALRLGELADRRLQLNDNSGILDTIVGMYLPDVAVGETLNLRGWEHDTVTDFRSDLQGRTEWDEGIEAVGELPADFLLLRSLRLKGWGRSLDTLSEPATDAKSVRGCAGLGGWFGSAAPEWMALRRCFPVAELLPAAAEGGRQRVRMWPADGGRVEEALYVPRPVVEGGILKKVSTRAVPRIAEKIAEEICKE